MSYIARSISFVTCLPGIGQSHWCFASESIFCPSFRSTMGKPPPTNTTLGPDLNSYKCSSKNLISGKSSLVTSSVRQVIFIAAENTQYLLDSRTRIQGRQYSQCAFSHHFFQRNPSKENLYIRRSECSLMVQTHRSSLVSLILFR